MSEQERSNPVSQNDASSKNAASPTDQSEEAEKGSKHTEEKNFAGCVLRVSIDEKGEARVKGLEGPCGEAFGKLSPIRKAFWFRRMEKRLREEIENQDENKVSESRASGDSLEIRR